jgi:hypothetical protein
MTNSKSSLKKHRQGKNATLNAEALGSQPAFDHPAADCVWENGGRDQWVMALDGLHASSCPGTLYLKAVVDTLFKHHSTL